MRDTFFCGVPVQTFYSKWTMCRMLLRTYRKSSSVLDTGSWSGAWTAIIFHVLLDWRPFLSMTDLSFYKYAWCEQLTHWKSPWCWERLRAEGEEGTRGCDGWTASLMRWTWTWATSGRWWGAGRPCVLQGSPRVGHNWVTEERPHVMPHLVQAGCDWVQPSRTTLCSLFSFLCFMVCITFSTISNYCLFASLSHELYEDNKTIQSLQNRCAIAEWLNHVTVA